jgi:hypothetical protein
MRAGFSAYTLCALVFNAAGFYYSSVKRAVGGRTMAANYPQGAHGGARRN